jgi:hypothetical protein
VAVLADVHQVAYVVNGLVEGRPVVGQIELRLTVTAL